MKKSSLDLCASPNSPPILICAFACYLQYFPPFCKNNVNIQIDKQINLPNVQQKCFPLNFRTSVEKLTKHDKNIILKYYVHANKYECTKKAATHRNTLQFICSAHTILFFPERGTSYVISF